MKAIQPDASRHDGNKEFPLPMQAKEVPPSEYRRDVYAPVDVNPQPAQTARPAPEAFRQVVPDVTPQPDKVPDTPMPANTAPNVMESAPSAPSSALAQDMVDRQEIYSDAAKPSRKRGIVLICLGVLMLLFAAFFFVSSLFSQPSTVKMTQLTQYEVPDGMLQEGTIDSATDIVYVYDLSEGDTPYAVESHAVRDGILGTTDLYEQWDGEKMFSEDVKDSAISGDVTNYRKIVIHLPSEAKGYVAGDADNGTAQ